MPSRSKPPTPPTPPAARRPTGAAAPAPASSTSATLHDLAELRQAWRRQQAAIEAHRQATMQREAEARRKLEEQDVFRRAVGPVTPLKPAARLQAHEARPRPEPLPLSRERDEQAALREALSDDFDVDSLLETDAELAYAREGVAPEVLRKLRRGVWVIQAELDLHGLRRDAARESLGAFLREAGRNGLRCVRVIHGKGHGSPGRTPVLKSKVRAWLVQKQEVMAFTQARACDGGAGALLVLLDAAPGTGSRADPV